MGCIGWIRGQASGRLIPDLASALKAGLDNETADLTNKSLRRVLALRAKGKAEILSIPAAIAFVHRGGQWGLREGNHRAVALCLLGAESLEGMNLTAPKQVLA